MVKTHPASPISYGGDSYDKSYSTYSSYKPSSYRHKRSVYGYGRDSYGKSYNSYGDKYDHDYRKVNYEHETYGNNMYNRGYGKKYDSYAKFYKHEPEYYEVKIIEPNYGKYGDNEGWVCGEQGEEGAECSGGAAEEDAERTTGDISGGGVSGGITGGISGSNNQIGVNINLGDGDS